MSVVRWLASESKFVNAVFQRPEAASDADRCAASVRCRDRLMCKEELQWTAQDAPLGRNALHLCSSGQGDFRLVLSLVSEAANTSLSCVSLVVQRPRRNSCWHSGLTLLLATRYANRGDTTHLAIATESAVSRSHTFGDLACPGGCVLRTG